MGYGWSSLAWLTGWARDGRSQGSIIWGGRFVEAPKHYPGFAPFPLPFGPLCLFLQKLEELGVSAKLGRVVKGSPTDLALGVESLSLFQEVKNCFLFAGCCGNMKHLLALSGYEKCIAEDIKIQALPPGFLLNETQ
jgi:hypothetical protein